MLYHSGESQEAIVDFKVMMKGSFHCSRKVFIAPDKSGIQYVHGPNND